MITSPAYPHIRSEAYGACRSRKVSAKQKTDARFLEAISGLLESGIIDSNGVVLQEPLPDAVYSTYNYDSPDAQIDAQLKGREVVDRIGK